MRLQIIVLQAWRFLHRMPVIIQTAASSVVFCLILQRELSSLWKLQEKKKESKCHIFAISTHKTTTQTRKGFKPKRLEPHPDLSPPTEWADWDPLFWSGFNSAVDGNHLYWLRKDLPEKHNNAAEFKFTIFMSLQVHNVSKNMQSWLYSLQVNLWGRRQEKANLPVELLSYPLSWQINSLTPPYTLLLP